MSVENEKLNELIFVNNPLINETDNLENNELELENSLFKITKENIKGKDAIQYNLFTFTENNLIETLPPIQDNLDRTYISNNLSIILKNNFLYIHKVSDNILFKLDLNKNSNNNYFNLVSFNLKEFLGSKLYKNNSSNIKIIDLIEAIPKEFKETCYKYKYYEQYDSPSQKKKEKLFSFIYKRITGDSRNSLSRKDIIVMQFISFLVCFKHYNINLDIDLFVKEYIQQFNSSNRYFNCLSSFKVTEIENKDSSVIIDYIESYNEIIFKNKLAERININGKLYLYSFEENKSDISSVLLSLYSIYNKIKKDVLFDANYYNKLFNLHEQDINYIHTKQIENNFPNVIKSDISIFIRKPDISNKNETAIDKRIQSLINIKQNMIYLKNKEHLIEINQKLDKEFPWMYNVNKEIVENLILNYEFSTGIKIPSIFIKGKPGIGKSYYINRLVELLDIPYTKYSASGKSEFLDFTGNSSNWGDSKPSLMCQLIANHNIINPLMFVDEIDKSLPNSNGDLQNSLLNLIDKNDSKHYFESYLSYNVDYSHINWIFAINDISKINQFLLDRAKVIEAYQPKEEHFDLIYDNILESYSKENNIEVSKILEVNISKDKIFNEFKMNYSLRKMKETIYKDISNHYYDKFFNINKKPKFNIV